jgi:hypothetical protein
MTRNLSRIKAPDSERLKEVSLRKLVHIFFTRHDQGAWKQLTARAVQDNNRRCCRLATVVTTGSKFEATTSGDGCSSLAGVRQIESHNLFDCLSIRLRD